MDMLLEIQGPLLCVAAHPEDLEIHAGGTVARLIDAGTTVQYVLCTSGNRGTDDPNLSMEEIGARREEEQRRAAAILGVKAVTFLRHDDGDLQYESRALREELVRLIRQFQPAAIITHDFLPGDGSLDSCAIYPDHLAVGKSVFEAAFLAAPAPLFYPEHLQSGLSLHKPAALYLIMSQNPNVFVDIGPVWDRKMAAVRQHESQGRHLADVPSFFRKVAWQLGHTQGLELAEGFRRLLPT